MRIFEIAVLVSAILSSGGFALAYAGFRRLIRAHSSRANTVPENPGLAKTRLLPKTGLLPVTVIVAAHNEAANIPGLLRALERQDYPTELIRLILAVDRSSDGSADTASAEIARLKSGKAMRISILETDDVPVDVSPKKFALAGAIEKAGTEHLLFTDADCRPGRGWIRGMAGQFEAGVDVVAGLAPLISQGGFISDYAAYETARTALFFAGAAGLGRPYMATGRNWGYTKTVYDKVGGLQPLFGYLGGDDDLLFQKFVAAGATTGSCLDPESACPSPAPSALRQLWRQKLRHYSVATSYRFPMNAVLGTHALAQSLAVPGTLALMFLNGTFTTWMLTLLLFGKLGLDTGFLFPVMRLFKRSEVMPTATIPVFHELFHIVFSGVAGLSSMLIKPRW